MLFLRQLEEIEGGISNLNKLKIQLTNQLEDAKRLADDEAKERQSLLGRYMSIIIVSGLFNQIMLQTLEKLLITLQCDFTPLICFSFILHRYRNLEHEFDGTTAVFEEEVASKQDAQRQLQKAEDDANHWRKKVTLR